MVPSSNCPILHCSIASVLTLISHFTFLIAFKGTIYKYLTSEPNPDFDAVLKFSKGLGIPIDAMIAAETQAHYKPSPLGASHACMAHCRLGFHCHPTLRLRHLWRRKIGRASCR